MIQISLFGQDKIQAILAKNRERFARNPKLMKLIVNGSVNLARTHARSHQGKTWREIANATNCVMLTEFSARIHCSHVAAAQRHFGGVIRARKKACLTIPIAEEARGRSVEDFTNLVRVGNALGFKNSDTFFPLFALCKQTRAQQPTPWWPTDDDVASIASKILQNTPMEVL